MKTKNHLHIPKDTDGDFLRGVGKLGWTEGGKMHSTIKRMASAFDNGDTDVKSKKTFKHEVSCPKCKKKFNLNNPNVIPNHKPGWRFNWSSDNKLCEGSTSRQPSGESSEEVIESFKFYENAHGPAIDVKVGSKMLIDTNVVNIGEKRGLVEFVVEKISRTNNLRNDGSTYSWRDFIKFEGEEKISYGFNTINSRNSTVI